MRELERPLGALVELSRRSKVRECAKLESTGSHQPTWWGKFFLIGWAGCAGVSGHLDRWVGSSGLEFENAERRPTSNGLF